MSSTLGKKRVLEMAASPEPATKARSATAWSLTVEHKTASEKRNFSQYLKEAAFAVENNPLPKEGIIVSISDKAFELGCQLRGEQFQAFKDASTAQQTRTVQTAYTKLITRYIPD